MADGRKMINIRLDSELWHKAKIQATVEGKTLQEYVEGALKSHLIKK